MNTYVLSDDIQGRLLNWKFNSAARYMREEIVRGADIPEEVQDTIRALDTTFGNVGWFDGVMSDIVRAAVWYLGVYDEGEG
jgi:hypothetical protein